MDRKERISIQRALVREAFGKLRAAEELFGADDVYYEINPSMSEFEQYSEKVNEFETWMFEEGPLA